MDYNFHYIIFNDYGDNIEFPLVATRYSEGNLTSIAMHALSKNYKMNLAYSIGCLDSQCKN
jgi:hypothetical protein